MKLFKIFLALALFTIFVNPALAEEFDPVGDLFSESNDVLFDLDLPTDFEEEYSAGKSATPVFEFPPDKTEAPATAPVNNFGEIVAGSGGAIEDYSSEEFPTSQPSKFLAAGAPRFVPDKSGRGVPAEISPFFYAPHSAANLSPTGPEAAIAIALFLTFATAWTLHKFLNV